MSYNVFLRHLILNKMKIKLLLFTFLIGLYSFSQSTFTTIASGDWENSSVWENGNIPTTNGIVILNNDITINSTTNVDTIDVNPEGSLTVNSSANLTFNSLNLKSSSTEFSSLILDGTISGTVNYNRFINLNASSGGNDLISAPLSGQAFNNFVTANPNIVAEPDPGIRVLFGDFNTDTSNYALWDETDTRILNAGEGYRSGTTDTNGYIFTGDVNTADINIPISIGAATRWNLIGNPYPSYIDAQSFLTTNASILDPNSTAIYGYNDSTDETTAGNRNRYTIINLLQNDTKNISPGQGLFLAPNTTGGSIQFLSSMRTNIGTDDFIQGRVNNVITNFKLKLTKDTDNFITDFYFTSDATLGLDPGYDATLFGESAPTFSIYSDLVQNSTGLSFAIQALGETDYTDVIIPLGINTMQGEQITISIENSTLPSTTEVYLDDNVSSTSTLLNSGDFVFTPNTNLSGTGRFYLRFSDSTLSTSTNDLSVIDIYTTQNNKSIIISGNLFENTIVKMYDIQGRIVNTESLATNSNKHYIDVSALQAGVYIVKLSNGNNIRTKKIIIK